MQWFIENAGPSKSTVGPVTLRMSTGMHSGAVHVFATGTSHRELIVTGPAATETIRLESDAEAGEVLVSATTAAALDDCGSAPRAELAPPAARRSRQGARPRTTIRRRRRQRRVLARTAPRCTRVAGVEPEHRHVVAAFVKFTGVEAVLEEAAPPGCTHDLQLSARRRARRRTSSG